MTLRRLTLALLILYALITVYSILGRPWGSRLPVSSLRWSPWQVLPLPCCMPDSAKAGDRALRLLALVFVVSLLFESVGVATGWVYGPYHYTDKLGPKFLGLVPYLIPVAWFMMSYPSFVIADRLVPSGMESLATATGRGGGRRVGDDRLGPGHGPDHGGGRVLGLGYERGLLRHSPAELLGLVADGLHHLCPVPVVFGKAAKPTEPRFDRLALVSYLVTALGIVLSRWSPARAGWH